MIEYKGKAPVNTRLNPIGPLEGKLSLAYYNSFVWATLVASGSVWVGRLKSPLAVKGLRPGRPRPQVEEGPCQTNEGEPCQTKSVKYRKK